MPAREYRELSGRDEMEKNLPQRGDRCWGWNNFSLLQLITSSGLWPPFTYNQTFPSTSSFPKIFSTKRNRLITPNQSILSFTEKKPPLVSLFPSLSFQKVGEEKSEVNFRAMHAKKTHACKHGARFIRARNELLCIGNKEQWPEMRNKGNV